MSIFVLALDLGQAQDYSALVINEAIGTKKAITLQSIEPVTGLPMPISRPVEILPITEMRIRHIERFPLGTRYSSIAGFVAERLQACPQPRHLVVDETGVGIGVIEMLARLRPIGITITGGNDATCPAPGKYRVPKRDLISPLQVRLQDGTLRIARSLPHADLLIKEMLAFRAKISASGHDTYEAWREAEHDDLVLAAGMSSWMAEELFRQHQREVEDAILQNAVDVQGEYRISAI